MLKLDPESHEYTHKKVRLPGVTHILQDMGFINTAWFTEYGRDRGSMAHRAIHLYDMGDLDEANLDPALVPYLNAWKRFLQDTGYEVLESENPYHHPTLKYAGTPDKIGEMAGKMAMVDIKTGAIQEWVRIQLSAYVEMVSPMQRFSLQLKPDGNYKLTEYKDRADRGIWLAVLAAYQWKQVNLRR